MLKTLYVNLFCEVVVSAYSFLVLLSSQGKLGTQFSILTLGILFTLVFIGTCTQTTYATPVIGGSCTKINTFRATKTLLAICTSKNGRLVWAKTNRSQQLEYEKQQRAKRVELEAKAKAELEAKAKAELEAKAKVGERLKHLEVLRSTREHYVDIRDKFPQHDNSLIIKVKTLIEKNRRGLDLLSAQLNAELKAKESYQVVLASLNQQITKFQTALNSQHSQINTLQATVDNLKANNDYWYILYVSAKSQSDSLIIPYQNARNDNELMLYAKVLCDFGFGYCDTYSTARYSYNLSVISQYNTAIARTSTANANYSAYNNDYRTGLNMLNNLKRQQSDLNNSLISLNTEKTQVTQTIASFDMKIALTEAKMKEAQSKFTPLESAEKRIEQDLLSISQMKDKVQKDCLDFISEIDAFLKQVDENFISSSSDTDWFKEIDVLNASQKQIDSKVIEIEMLIQKLETYLKSL